MKLYLLMFVLANHLFSELHGQTVVDTNPKDDWNLDEMLSFVTNDTARAEKINSVLSAFIAKADKLYRGVEGEVKDLTKEAIRATRLDPSVVNRDCKCFCHCPQNTIENKIMQDVKMKVTGLKYAFTKLGSVIKKKIHEFTSG